MTLLPSGSPYFPKDINLLAPLPALSFKCHHSQKKKMLSRLQILLHWLPLTWIFCYIYRLYIGCGRAPWQNWFPKSCPSKPRQTWFWEKGRLQLNVSLKYFCFVCSRQIVSPNRLSCACAFLSTSYLCKSCGATPRPSGCATFQTLFCAGRIDWSLCRSGGKGEGREKEPREALLGAGPTASLLLYPRCTDVWMWGYTLLAVDLDPLLYCFLSNQWFVCFECNSWETTTKRVGLACEWPHNDFIYLARSEWAEQSRD